MDKVYQQVNIRAAAANVRGGETGSDVQPILRQANPELAIRAAPARHWELDADGQPTQRIIPDRRKAKFITPIPKPKKRKGSAAQQELVFDEGKGPLDTEAAVRSHLDQLGSARQRVEGRVLPRGRVPSEGPSLHQMIEKAVQP